MSMSSWREKMQPMTPFIHVDRVISPLSATDLRDDFIDSLHETDGWMILVQIRGQKVDPDDLTANKWTTRIPLHVSLHGVFIFLRDGENW